MKWRNYIAGGLEAVALLVMTIAGGIAGGLFLIAQKVKK